MESYKQPEITPESSDLFELQMDHENLGYLNETARWAKFLAIVGFVAIGFMLLMGIFFGSIFGAMSSFSGASYSRIGLSGSSLGFTFLYIALAALYFFPTLYLFNFATKMQVAIRNNDQFNLNAAFKNLKSCFKFLGILTIVLIAFYVLAIIIGIAAAAFISR
jgi:hypothetical protein